jgi:hypothetical protein
LLLRFSAQVLRWPGLAWLTAAPSAIDFDDEGPYGDRLNGIAHTPEDLDARFAGVDANLPKP